MIRPQPITGESCVANAREERERERERDVLVGLLLYMYITYINTMYTLPTCRRYVQRRYGLWRRDGSLTFFVDGTETWHVNASSTAGAGPAVFARNASCFDGPMQVFLTVDIADDAGGINDADDARQIHGQARIQYFRFWPQNVDGNNDNDSSNTNDEGGDGGAASDTSTARFVESSIPAGEGGAAGGDGEEQMNLVLHLAGFDMCNVAAAEIAGMKADLSNAVVASSNHNLVHDDIVNVLLVSEPSCDNRSRRQQHRHRHGRSMDTSATFILNEHVAQAEAKAAFASLQDAVAAGTFPAVVVNGADGNVMSAVPSSVELVHDTGTGAVQTSLGGGDNTDTGDDSIDAGGAVDTGKGLSAGAIAGIAISIVTIAAVAAVVIAGVVLKEGPTKAKRTSKVAPMGALDNTATSSATLQATTTNGSLPAVKSSSSGGGSRGSNNHDGGGAIDPQSIRFSVRTRP